MIELNNWWIQKYGLSLVYINGITKEGNMLRSQRIVSFDSDTMIAIDVIKVQYKLLKPRDSEEAIEKIVIEKEV